MRSLWFFLALTVMASFGIYAESVNENDGKTYGQADQDDRPPTYSIPPLLERPIDNKENTSTVKTKEEEAEKREIADLIAQEGMNRAAQAMNEATQRLADDTESIAKYTFWMTIAAWVTFVLLIPTLILTYKANKTASANLREVEKTNILQLQPWLTIGCPSISPYIVHIPNTEIGEASFRIVIPIKNDGKTPVKGIEIDFPYIYVQLRNDSGGRLYLKSVISSQDRSMPLNPAVRSRQVILCSCRRVSGHEQPPISDFTGDDVDIRINMEADIRFIDISTPKGELKRINFIFDNVHNDEPVDQLRISDALKEKRGPYFKGVC